MRERGKRGWERGIGIGGRERELGRRWRRSGEGEGRRGRGGL